ncbi:ATP-binding protein [Candidatus Babeliales bacterium]|nr:ATP-binding protein [Candidatus Babeliales bacterium]MCF7899432.1 ATP-binding protein [Candidatus Babeliales bacterium]
MKQIIPRILKNSLLESSQQLPVVAILGPRQSGKTTLAKTTFDKHKYVSLEDLDTRQRAIEDPRKFLSDICFNNNNGVILDEFQNAPAILSYIQTIVDEQEKPGYFILTGSQNFLVNQEITQTLAGRIALLTLLPLSITELKNNNILPKTVEDLIFKGAYPRIYARNVNPITWYRDYIETYLERDVRLISHVKDLVQFKYFVQLCAGRIGQVVNYSSLASDCGIDTRTAKEWLSLLQASYIIFTLQPHNKNFNRRLIKSPKLYFYDTGLVCSLLKIESREQLLTHYMRGNLFECLVISELYKHFFNKNRRPSIYFWRDNHGHEIDCIIEKASKLIPIEIKSSMTAYPKIFNELQEWYKISETQVPNGYVIYGGDENQSRLHGIALSWKNLNLIDI